MSKVIKPARRAVATTAEIAFGEVVQLPDKPMLVAKLHEFYAISAPEIKAPTSKNARRRVH